MPQRFSSRTPRYALVFDECELDIERYELRRAGHAVVLAPKPFRVLVYPLRHHGRA
jgi:DNA-binding response OmpR family regulator